MKKKRSFLKWAGGKYSLIEDIVKILPQKKCLIEPFVGSGSIFLNTNFNSYILSDINSDLINLFNIVKSYFVHFIKDANFFLLRKLIMQTFILGSAIFLIKRSIVIIKLFFSYT